MAYDPDRHHRRSSRLRGYDDRSPGYYFVTLCTHRRVWLFGEVRDGVMHLNAFGRVVATLWSEMSNRNPNVRPDAFRVMPNHLHGLIEIISATDVIPGSRLMDNSEVIQPDQPRGVTAGSLGAILGNVQSITTRRINHMRHTQGARVWQRNYWDRIVRSQVELKRIRAYIISNPALWTEDRLYQPDADDP